MSGPANVRSTDAILAVRAAWVKFANQTVVGLEEIEAELRRLLDWMEHERPGHWREQSRKAWDDLAHARADLHQKLMFPLADERPSCIEQRRALKQAEERLAYCEAKARKLQVWVREVSQEITEYKGRTAALMQLTDVETPLALAALDRILTGIAAYTGGTLRPRRSEGGPAVAVEKLPDDTGASTP